MSLPLLNTSSGVEVVVAVEVVLEVALVVVVQIYHIKCTMDKL